LWGKKGKYQKKKKSRGGEGGTPLHKKERKTGVRMEGDFAFTGRNGKKKRACLRKVVPVGGEGEAGKALGKKGRRPPTSAKKKGGNESQKNQKCARKKAKEEQYNPSIAEREGR